MENTASASASANISANISANRNTNGNFIYTGQGGVKFMLVQYRPALIERQLLLAEFLLKHLGDADIADITINGPFGWEAALFKFPLPKTIEVPKYLQLMVNKYAGVILRKGLVATTVGVYVFYDNEEDRKLMQTTWDAFVKA